MTITQAVDHLLHQHVRYLLASPVEHDTAEASLQTARKALEDLFLPLPVVDAMKESLDREIRGMKA